MLTSHAHHPTMSFSPLSATIDHVYLLISHPNLLLRYKYSVPPQCHACTDYLPLMYGGMYKGCCELDLKQHSTVWLNFRIDSLCSQNHPVERIWVEVNSCVNYPIKSCLIHMEENNNQHGQWPSQIFDFPFYHQCLGWLEQIMWWNHGISIPGV